MLWVYGHYNVLIFSVRGSDFPALKGLNLSDLTDYDKREVNLSDINVWKMGRK